MRSHHVPRHRKTQRKTTKPARAKRPKWRKVPRTIGLIQWIPSGTYFANIRRGKRVYRESLGTKDLPFAKRKLEAFRHRIDRTDPRYGRMTLVQWLEDCYAPTLRGARSTVTNKLCVIEKVRATWLAARVQPLRELKPSEVERWMNEQFGSWSEAYYNAALTVIRDALAMAVRDRVIYESPAAGLSHRKRRRPIRLTPTWEQFNAIVNDIRSQEFNGHGAEESADFIEFCGLAGLGQAEVSGMQRAHVDLDSNRIAIFRHKTSVAFHVPIYPQLRPLLEKLCEGKKPNQHLFGIGQARAALENACERLEFPPFTHRSLRRMFVTRCLELGVDVKTVSEFQGHRDGGKLILDTYSHVRQPHAQRMAQLLTVEQPENLIPLRASDASAQN
jgi:integrase